MKDTSITRTPTFKIGLIALLILAVDQLTKHVVLRFMGLDQERVVLKGFFKFVHWGNTGAAWSLFTGKNQVLALVALGALVVLYMSRHYFDAHTRVGQISLGLIFGGILGNLIDRLLVHHVIDFIRFYLERRGGDEIGFPAFNIADSAICVGVGLIFIQSWKSDAVPANPVQPPAQS